ncbi:MAG TPA: S-layer homology domain-containing protein [Leptolyngbyaceae cyanobacterium M65_K2018_010]|nr:S-layer homology domain-containing protein [Leptolyngbyaceae cyanobacterium M65_K2018_010]
MSVVTQSLLGQSPEVVQAALGPVHHQQPNPDNQTELYVFGSGYLRGVFPVQTTGIIGVFRHQQCIALKIVFSKVDPRYDRFVYNREIASRLFERVVGNDYAYWQELEAEARANQTIHYVYCMGHHTATTWDAHGHTHTLASDISIFLDHRCNPGDSSELTQPLALAAQTTAGQAFLRRQATGPLKPLPEPLKIAEVTPLTDITGNPYEAQIAKAVSPYRVIGPYPDGSFRPSEGVSRDQGVTMLIAALQQMAVDGSAIAPPLAVTAAPFADVPLEHPSAPRFALAQSLGLIFGDDDDRVYPDAPMTRAEFMAMTYNGLQALVELNYGPTTVAGDVIEPLTPTGPFADIEGHWGETIIREMATYGIASPLYEIGNAFGPEAPLQRDYAAAVLVRLIEVPRQGISGVASRPSQTAVFADIGNDPYKDEILRAANQYGLVPAADDKSFHPTDALSREQAVVMLVHALQSLVKQPEALKLPETLSDPPPYADVTAGVNATKIQWAKQAGLIPGDDPDYFRPLDKISRAQLMAMIYRGLEFVVQANYGRAVPWGEAITLPDRPPLNFTDIPETHEVKAPLLILSQLGIATPEAEVGTEFRPEQPTLRNYGTAALVRLLELPWATPAEPSPPAPAITFTDLKGSPYSEAVLRAANQYKLVAGYEDGSFKPNSPVSREQAVALLVDALRQKVVNKTAILLPDHLTQPPFADVDLNRWSAPRLYFARRAGIVAGDDRGRFNPEAPVSRAQLIAMTHQALRYALWVDFGKTTVPIAQLMAPATPYRFEDVPDHHWAAALIQTLATIGLALPRDQAAATIFSPDTPAYRDYTVATVVGFLEAPYREPATPLDTLKFMDLAGSPYAAEIQRAVSQYHLIAGNQDGTFRPAESISREHLVAMVVAAIKARVKDPLAVTIPEVLTRSPFEDVPVSNPFAARIKFVAEAGIMTGDRGTGLFRPKNDLSRAELMAVVDKTLAAVVRHQFGEGVSLESVTTAIAPIPTFTDLEGHWAQATIARMAALGLAIPFSPGGAEFLPNRPARRDFAAAVMVRMIELPLTRGES